MIQTIFGQIGSARCCSKIIGFIAALFVLDLRAETSPQYYAVEASAGVQVSPPQITLNWGPDWNATGYIISRKAKEATSWTQLTALTGAATSFADVNVAVGATYEYQ